MSCEAIEAVFDQSRIVAPGLLQPVEVAEYAAVVVEKFLPSDLQCKLLTELGLIGIKQTDFPPGFVQHQAVLRRVGNAVVG
ncbi:hypothetical protein D3C87_1824940 [compost metagenome]